MKTVKFREHLTEMLKDSELAVEYISTVMEDNDPQFMKEALLEVVKAHGMKNISEASGLARQAIYKMLSEKGNPTLQSIVALLDAVGLELDVKAKKKKKAS